MQRTHLRINRLADGPSMARRCTFLVLAALWLWGGVSCLRIQYSPLDSSDNPLVILIAGAVSPQSVRVSSVQKLGEGQGGFSPTLADNDVFSHAVTSPGDLDGDGLPDFAISAYQDNDGGAARGAVYILFMNGDGTIRTQQKISHTQGGVTPPLTNGDRFGYSACSLGDLDGDGTLDMMVGAATDEDGGSQRGSLYSIFLNTNGTVSSLQKISDTEGGFTATLENQDWFGAACTSIGDLNGDGINDVAVGVEQDDDGGTDRGAVYILFMNTNGTVSSFQKISATDGGFIGILDDVDRFGRSLAHLGDLDGDGRPELAVGVSTDDDGGTDRGAVFILSLNSNGTVAQHQKISATEGGFNGPLSDGDNFGISLAAPGDLNNDGASDLVVGAYRDDGTGLSNRGAIYILFLKSDGNVNYHARIGDSEGGLPDVLSDGDLFGLSVTAADNNGSGLPVLLVGAVENNGSGGAIRRGAAYVLFLERVPF